MHHLLPHVDEDEDDWNLPSDFNLYAKHKRYSVHLGNNDESFVLECLEQDCLTPLDVVSSTTNNNVDETGAVVWTGACWFLACLEEMKECFIHRNVLELGCGTGISGIGLLKTTPCSVCFTDADPTALQLCERNCILNSIPPAKTTFETLLWGDPPESCLLWDAVFGADILYDISMLPAILQTAQLSLKQGGYFILSHVPRACYNSKYPPVDNLEEYIVEQATGFFSLVKRIRPRDLITTTWNPPEDCLNNMSLDEMEEAGAVLFVFQKE